jgi:hypothetical protein
MRRTVLGSAAIVSAIAMVGCGGTNTKTVVTIENHTTTATTTTTVTTTTAASPPAASASVTKCGKGTTACPVVVRCPTGGGRASEFECRGVVGVAGDHIRSPRPGPDATGLGLTCSWGQPAYDRASRTVISVCDPGA